MTKTYHLIVFDWEGTLGDTLGQVVHAIIQSARLMNLEPVSEASVRQSLALGLNKAIQKLFPNQSIQLQEQLLQQIQQALVLSTTEVYLLPGARTLIQQLYQQGVQLAIATNKGQQGLQRVLHASGLGEYIKATRSAGKVPPKPCPQMLEEIITECGERPENTLMIGDSIADMEMAHALAVDAVGVDFYHQQAQALQSAGAIEVFDDYQKVANFLQQRSGL